MTEPSVRLFNIMLSQKFLIFNGNYSQLEFEEAAQLFYDYCIVEMPSTQCPPDHYGRRVRTPARPKWRDIPNFGKKTLDELKIILKIPQQEPVMCLGYLVPHNVYKRLKTMAGKARI